MAGTYFPERLPAEGISMPTNEKQTSKPVARFASKLLKEPGAGGALGQAGLKAKRATKKARGK